MFKSVFNAAIIAGIVSPAVAAWDNTLYSAPDPSTFGTQIDFLNANDTYAWPSAFVNQVGPVTVDTSSLTTTVFQVHTQTVINIGQGPMVLNPGDHVFSYRYHHVSGNTSTLLDSINELQIQGLDPNIFPSPHPRGLVDPIDFNLINGRGYFVPGTAGSPDDIGDPRDDFIFGQSIDFEWTGPISDQVENGEDIILMLFTGPGIAIGNGYSAVGGPPPPPGAAQNIPVLIPIIPSPGAAALAGLAIGLGATSRRRRG